jgi:hypothetical protein
MLARVERQNRAITEQLDQLARDIADARSGGRRDTEDLVADLRRETIDALAERFRDTDATLREHTTTLQRMLARQRRNTNPPVPWHSMDAIRAARQWSHLADWIDDVFVPWDTITRDELPDCWAMHRPVLVQLSWLRTAHIQAYLPDSDPGLAADWHVRWSPTVLRKIKTLIAEEMCRPGEHMISLEESNCRRRAAMTGNPPPGQPGGGAVELGRQQLARRQYWDAFYLQARDQDLAWRTQRDEWHRANPRDDDRPEDE